MNEEMTPEIVEDDEVPADEDQQAPESNEVDTPADLEVEDPTIDQTGEDEDLGEE